MLHLTDFKGSIIVKVRKRKKGTHTFEPRPLQSGLILHGTHTYLGSYCGTPTVSYHLSCIPTCFIIRLPHFPNGAVGQLKQYQLPHLLNITVDGIMCCAWIGKYLWEASIAWDRLHTCACWVSIQYSIGFKITLWLCYFHFPIGRTAGSHEWHLPF